MKTETQIRTKIAFLKDMRDRKIHEDMPRIETPDNMMNQLTNSMMGRMVQLGIEYALTELEWVLNDE